MLGPDPSRVLPAPSGARGGVRLGVPEFGANGLRRGGSDPGSVGVDRGRDARPSRRPRLQRIGAQAQVPGMLDPATRLNAALEGRYRIDGELGKGGMATVFLADDLKHERKVALKVLEPELAAVVGAERFLAEIRTTANLQHPNILPLFDSGEADGLLFYVMPYVRGESLRDRLDRDQQLPVADAVRMVTSVAEALDYAHRQGVIHRDIKPANVLLQDGKPMVSDFGIALAVGSAGHDRLTETGLSLGTPSYMSPEQATGSRTIGARADVYALACVLYECLAGEPPFTASTPQAVLGRIVTGEAEPVSRHRPGVPANVESAITRGLEKVPADRFASAKDFAVALADAAFRYGSDEMGPVGHARRTVLLASAVAALVVGVGLGWLMGRGALLQPDLRYGAFDLPLQVGQRVGSPVAISPDGTRLAYVTEIDGGDRAELWIRDRSEPEATIVLERDLLETPVFSPDGERVAVVAWDQDRVWRIVSLAVDGRDVATVLGGGSADRVLRGNNRMGLAWGEDGYLYTGSGAGLVRIPEGGGAPELVTRADTEAGEVGHYSPSALPAGRGGPLHDPS